MTSGIVIPPALLLLGGALLLPLLPRRIRSAAFLVFTLGALILVWQLPEGLSLEFQLMDYSLIVCQADALSRIFGLIFAFIAFAGGIYAWHIKDTGQQCAALLYAGGALGVTFARDFFTLFVFWELMALGSVYLIWARRNKAARRAGFRYILYHVLGGGILFSGILLHISRTGSLALESLAPGGPLSSWLILLGVGINAAVPPLHAWLSDAYPKATVTGAVFLSAFTTKTAVYVLVRLFPGWEILLVLGTIMTLYGVLFAILANDIRGILAYHIISQVGYMVAGVGIGTELGLSGTTAHAFSHILYKALLFMGAGVVLETTGRTKLTELGGLHKTQKLTLALYLVAAFSISGFPLFNGFISKSMVVSAAGEAHHEWAMLGMLLAAVGTFLSVGLKLPYYTWFAKDSGLEPVPAPRNMHLGMGLVGLICILHGIKPSLLYVWLPFPVHFEPFSVPHLVETVQILIFTFAAFWLMRTRLLPHDEIALDVDWFYRAPGRRLGKAIVDGTARLYTQTDRLAEMLTARIIHYSRDPKSLWSRGADFSAYSPDRDRPLIRSLLTFLLLLFIGLVILGLISSR